MDSRTPFAQLGDPNLQVGGLRLWIHGREFPESTDYWDANWLLVTAECSAEGARVWAQGALLTTSDIAGFAHACEELHRGTGSAAELTPLEPEVALRLKRSNSRGHISAEVMLTADHLAQQHRMVFALDQSYLPRIIASCARIMEEYPVRHFKDEGV